MSEMDLFANLWGDYTSFNPEAKKLYDLILKKEQSIDPAISNLKNDHIALRTLNVPKISLLQLAKIFENFGYIKAGDYQFPNKKLYAQHFEHLEKDLPKVFISELEVEKFSPVLQKVAAEIELAVPDLLVNDERILWSGRLWKADYLTYEKLLEESEYAAWFYAFGFRPNHFTISVNHLKSLTTLSELNDFVRQNGYILNESGGEIKGSAEQLLEQSSTMAEKTIVDFIDGRQEIPACYYEFAKRYPIPDRANGGSSGRLFSGFISTSADKIFESTDVSK